MLSLKKYYFLFILFFNGSVLFAQNTVKTEEREVFFRINFVVRFNDTVFAFIDEAKNLGLQKGMPVKGFKSYTAPYKDEKEIKFHQAGSGRISKADSFVMCLVKLNNITDTLAPGDLISLNLNIPSLAYRGIFSTLVFNKTEFIGFSKDTLYSLQDIMYRDSPAKENSIFSTIVKDLHNAYDKVKDWPTLSPLYRTKATAGRYKDKSPLDVMRDATRTDVERFLTYIMDYPDNYRGKYYKFAESMTAWLLVNAIYSPTEVKNALFPVYKNKAAFLKLLPIYKKDIITDSHCSIFTKWAERLIAKEKNADAFQLIDFTKVLAYAVNDTNGKALAYLYEAELLHKQNNNFKGAITLCDSAIKYSLQLGNREYELAAMIKKIYCHYVLLQYAEAKNLLKQTEEKIIAYRPVTGDALYYSNLQKKVEYEGSIYYAEGNYEKSLKAYARGIELNKEFNTYDALLRNAAYYTFIGRVNNDQRKPLNALDSFIKAAYIYRINYDTLNWAKIQNDMAYSYFKLSNYRNCLTLCDTAINKLLSFKDYDNAGYSKSLMGSCYWELGKYDSAVMAHKEAISLRKKGKNLSGQAYSWKQIGELYLLSGLKKDALNAYDSARVIYDTLKDFTNLAEVYNKRGLVFYNDENYKKAIDLFEKAKGISSKTTAEALYNLGNAWLEIDTAKARPYFVACQTLSDTTKNTGYLFDATRALASLAYAGHNKKEGDRLYNECINLSKQLNTANVTASCITLKARSFYKDNRMDSALFYYKKALSIYDTVNQSGAIWQLNNIANVQISMGNFHGAEESYNKAIKLAQDTKNKLGLGFTLQSYSFLNAQLGEFIKGMENNDSAAAIFKRSDNLLRLANTLGSRGSVYSGMGNYKKAIQTYLTADSIYQSEGAIYYRSNTFNNIGVVYFNQNDYARAVENFNKAASYFLPGVKDESYFLNQGNIAECYYYQKKSPEAEKILLEIYPLAIKDSIIRIGTSMAISLGKIYYDAGQMGKAEAYFQQAKVLSERSGAKDALVDVLQYLGKIEFQKGNSVAAQKNLEEAVSIVKQYGLVNNGWEPYYETGLIYYHQQKHDSATANFKEAIDIIEKNTENLFGDEQAKKIYKGDERKVDLYNKTIASYAALGDKKKVAEYSLRNSYAAVNSKYGADNDIKNITSKEDYDKLNELTLQKAAVDVSISKATTPEQQQALLEKKKIAEAGIQDFINKLKQKDTAFSKYFAERENPENFFNYKGELPDDTTAVVSYVVSDSLLVVFVLSNAALEVHTTKMKEDINVLVDEYVNALKAPDSASGTGSLKVRAEFANEVKSGGEFTAVSEKLYKLLFEDIKDDIKGIKRLCIIPTGKLSNIPFQCLGKRIPDKSFHFLVEDYTVFYTNRMDLFRGVTVADKNLSTLAAFGNPDKSLEFAKKEVMDIKKVVNTSTVYVEGVATEANAKLSLQQNKYVHFATHGTLDYINPLQSYLTFTKTPGNNDDGKLSISEIDSMLVTKGFKELVTLSACETAVPVKFSKDWYVSPANSFLRKKFKSVIASLWKVNDEATGILMTEFYKNLETMDKAEALRRAQETLSKDERFIHPFYWGAFVLYGDWR